MPVANVAFRLCFGSGRAKTRISVVLDGSSEAFVTAGRARPRPPAGLGAAAKRWWTSIVDLYDVESDPATLRLLADAAMTIDLLERLHAEIGRGGILVESRLGEQKLNPLIVEQRQQRGELRRILAQLGLEDGEPAPDLRYSQNRHLKGRR
jgi:phage terminase small subunit